MEELSVGNRIRCLQPVVREQLSQTFSAESVVPDTMPDISSILCSDAEILLRTGSVNDGGVTLEGTIQGTVLYLCEEDSLPRKLSLTIPVLITSQNASAAQTDQLVFHAVFSGAEARPINTRKISFRAEVGVELNVYREDFIDLSVDDDQTSQLEILPEETTVGFVLDLREKTFTVADEVDLPSPMEQLLWYHTELFAESAKKVGGKMVLQGGIELTLLYLTTEEETPRCERFRIPFSQIIDAPEGESEQSVVHFRCISCFVEMLSGLNGADSVSLEMQLSAQILYTGERTVSYIADAYSLRRAVSTIVETAQLAAPYSFTVKKKSLKEHLPLPERADEIICTQIRTTLPVHIPGGIRLTANACVLYRTENGDLRTAIKKISAEYPEDQSNIDCVYCRPLCGEVFTSLRNDGIDLQFDMELTVLSAEKQGIPFVSAIQPELREDMLAEDVPSIVAVRTGNRSLWELAKTYHSTVELIESANPGEENGHTLVLIPRGR